MKLKKPLFSVLVFIILLLGLSGCGSPEFYHFSGGCEGAGVAKNIMIAKKEDGNFMILDEGLEYFLYVYSDPKTVFDEKWYIPFDLCEDMLISQEIDGRIDFISSAVTMDSNTGTWWNTGVFKSTSEDASGREQVPGVSPSCDRITSSFCASAVCIDPIGSENIILYLSDFSETSDQYTKSTMIYAGLEWELPNYIYRTIIRIHEDGRIEVEDPDYIAVDSEGTIWISKEIEDSFFMVKK